MTGSVGIATAACLTAYFLGLAVSGKQDVPLLEQAREYAPCDVTSGRTACRYIRSETAVVVRAMSTVGNKRVLDVARCCNTQSAPGLALTQAD
jgi:hypothetical protein